MYGVKSGNSADGMGHSGKATRKELKSKVFGMLAMSSFLIWVLIGWEFLFVRVCQYIAV
jgi:hypothetical protein